MTRVILDRQGIAELFGSERGPVAKELSRLAVRVDGEAKRLAKQPGRGRLYRRGNIVHRASAPGDPFATDTGQAAASITWSLGHDRQGLFAVVGSNLRKVLYLELGTMRMAPRPTLRRALAKVAGR